MLVAMRHVCHAPPPELDMSVCMRRVSVYANANTLRQLLPAAISIWPPCANLQMVPVASVRLRELQLACQCHQLCVSANMQFGA